MVTILKSVRAKLPEKRTLEKVLEGGALLTSGGRWKTKYKGPEVGDCHVRSACNAGS